jgi:hypothetical protein
MRMSDRGIHRLRDGFYADKWKYTKHFRIVLLLSMLGGIPVPTAWRVLGLRMEERPPDMEVSGEYIE